MFHRRIIYNENIYHERRDADGRKEKQGRDQAQDRVGGVAADAFGVTAAANGIKEGWNSFAQDGGVFGLGRDSKDVRDAQRQRDVNKLLDDREKGKNEKNGGGDSGGGGGNKDVPPTSSDEFDAQLSQEGNPNSQQNLSV